ncbi:MAG TPA: alpha-hydroxy acid oxidase [Solirubrobacteraceae bacterium]|nr:alpha-hydroxy acid oxidase [Solirubrobacteraceae bacterium]
MPRPVFDYVDGAAKDEISLRRARATYAGLEFVPSVLRDVGSVDLSISSLGTDSALPFALAPTGFTRLMHHEGEPAVARAADAHRIPYALSTLGTTSAEEFARDRRGPLWFQLYVWRDRPKVLELVERVAASGYSTLILTVDVPVAGARLRDVRNGFSIPPALTPSTLVALASRPRWWADLLTTAPIEFASLTRWDGTVGELIDQLFDPTMTLSDLEWLRSTWTGRLVVKGIQSCDDARRVVDAGADAIVSSNHGGRQLDRAPIPLLLLDEIVAEVGERAEVWVDTGVLSGTDIVAAHALGASNVLVGRAYLYGLMAGGEAGVRRALTVLTNEITRTLKLLGVKAIGELRREHVRIPAAWYETSH